MEPKPAAAEFTITGYSFRIFDLANKLTKTITERFTYCLRL